MRQNQKILCTRKAKLFFVPKNPEDFLSMARCDMCGKDTYLVIALIEGTELRVSDKCTKFGKIIRKVKAPKPVKNIKKSIRIKEEPEEEIIERFIDGYGKIIKESREKLKIKQEDFAKRINEKTSLIHGIESEHHEPSIKLAKKIEKFLKIELIEEEKLEGTDLKHEKAEAFTIGDIIKSKK